MLEGSLAFEVMSPDRQSGEQDPYIRTAQRQQRKINIRLRELESEIDASTSQKPAQRQQVRPWYKRLPKLVSVSLLVVTAIVVVRVAAWLAGVLLFFGILWMGYKLFIERG